MQPLAVFQTMQLMLFKDSRKNGNRQFQYPPSRCPNPTIGKAATDGLAGQARPGPNSGPGASTPRGRAAVSEAKELNERLIKPVRGSVRHRNPNRSGSSGARRRNNGRENSLDGFG
jgi:hypothetical protein